MASEPCGYCRGVRLVGWSGAGPLLCPECSHDQDAFTVITQAWREQRAEVIRLSAELSAAQEMREVLREHQWSSEHHHEDSDCGHGYPVCPECGSGVPGPKWGAPPGLDMGHAPDCRLARLIGGDSP